MKLNNTLIIKGSFDALSHVQTEMINIKNKAVHNNKVLTDATVIKRVRQITVELSNLNDTLTVSFLFKGRQVKHFIDLFSSFPVEVISLTESKKYNVWIVSNTALAAEHQLIPPWAIHGILHQYMAYLESSIMLDNYSSLQYDRNKNTIVRNDEKLSDEEITDIFFNHTINGKPIDRLLEQFIFSFSQECINQYEDLYSSNEEKLEIDKTTPLALFIVTFGLFALIIILLLFMGYL